MHTIFVTLEEFLANGGRLTDRKELFDGTEYNTFECMGWFDIFEPTAPEGMTTVCQGNRTFQLDNPLIYVEIPVTPLYK